MKTKIADKVISVDDKFSYAHCISETKQFIRKSVKELIDEAADSVDPERKAFLFPHNFNLELTFRDVQTKTRHLAQNLLNLGFKKGDRLGIAVDNTYEVLITFLACASIGVVTTLFSPNFKIFEFEHLLKKTGAKGLLIFNSIGDKNFYEIIQKVCPELASCEKGQLSSPKFPNLKHIFVINRSQSIQTEEGQERPSVDIESMTRYPGCWCYEEISTGKVENQNGEKDCEWPYVDLDDLLLITFTSGTTGTPKGATHKHFSMINNTFVSSRYDETNVSKEVSCSAFPMMHIGFPTFVMSTLINRVATLFPFKLFNAEEAVQGIHKYRASIVIGSPRMLDEILKYPHLDKYDLSCIKVVFTGGSISTLELGLRYKAKFGTFIFGNGLGSSESVSVSGNMWMLHDPNLKYDPNISSVGYPAPFVETKVVDENGQIVPLKQDGILHVRSFALMAKYWDEPERTKEAIDSNGWYNTGDLVSMEPDGDLHYKSRVKETIKIYDHSIYPFEVETYLNKHPNIEESCVFGIKITQFEEAVCAWIKLKDASLGTSVDDIKAFCKENFADTKAPRYIKIIDDFPDKTALGKLPRSKFSEEFKQELGL